MHPGLPQVASQFGFRDLVSLLLRRGASVDVASVKGDTALTWVAGDGGHFDILDVLLQNGASVEGCSNGTRPLLRAVSMGRGAMVQALVQAGAQVGAQEGHGVGALHVAAFIGRADICTALLTAGADVEAVSEAGDTAMHIARRLGHREVVRVLEAQVKEARRWRHNEALRRAMLDFEVFLGGV